MAFSYVRTQDNENGFKMYLTTKQMYDIMNKKTDRRYYMKISSTKLKHYRKKAINSRKRYQ